MSKGKFSQVPDDGKVTQLDLLLKEKYDAERLADWKKLMPMPESDPVPKSSNWTKHLWILIALAVISAAAVFFSSTSTNPIKLADSYLKTTTIASLDDQNARGETITNKGEHTDFYQIINNLKLKKTLSIKELETLSTYKVNKNKYQAEALWFCALANIKSGNEVLAKEELTKLTTISTYKKEESNKLIRELNK